MHASKRISVIVTRDPKAPLQCMFVTSSGACCGGVLAWVQLLSVLAICLFAILVWAIMFRDWDHAVNVSAPPRVATARGRWETRALAPPAVCSFYPLDAPSTQTAAVRPFWSKNRVPQSWTRKGDKQFLFQELFSACRKKASLCPPVSSHCASLASPKPPPPTPLCCSAGAGEAGPQRDGRERRLQHPDADAGGRCLGSDPGPGPRGRALRPSPELHCHSRILGQTLAQGTPPAYP